MKELVENRDLDVFLYGDVHDVKWRRRMRALLEKCSAGPYDVGEGDSRFDGEPMAVVTNARREVIAKCGPMRDSRSCFDAIAVAAALNGVVSFLNACAIGDGASLIAIVVA